MAINVSSWSIRNPIPAILLFGMLTLLGLYGFKAMKVQNLPDMDLPIVTVTLTLPGAAPSQLETEVVRKVENSMATIQGLKHLYANIQDGAATLTAEFRLEKPLQEGVDDVRDAVARVRADLPADLRDPIVQKKTLTGSPILTYSVAAEHQDDEALSWFIDNTVTKAMLAVPGVGAVARVGGANREVRVELDPARLMALGVSAADVSRRLRQVQQDASGGRTDIGGGEQSVRTLANVGSADELGALELHLADGRRLRLDQVATVRDTVAEIRSYALLNGKPVVAFEITRTRGAGEVEVARGVRATIQRLQAEHPGTVFTESFNFVDSVQESFEGSMSLLYEGAALAVLVVWLFLRNWRATLVAAVALPLSVLPTYAAIHFLGFSLNVITLLSLSLVVGILVDDAIVEIENIMRHLRMGKTPYQAAMEAADEIGLAVIATTFTLIAVFLPTAFMSGITGRFFIQFGWTAAIAVFFSLVVARMLTPMMAAYLLRPVSAEAHEPGWLRVYLRWARSCFQHRVLTTVAVTLFFFGSFSLVFLLKATFFPPDDVAQTQITLQLAPGSTAEQTRQSAERARALIAQHPQVRRVYTAVAGGLAGSDPFAPPNTGDVTRATLTLDLTPRDERPGLSKQDIEHDLRHRLEALPGVRSKVGLGGTSEKYVLVLASEDGAALAAHAPKVERALRGLQGIGNISSSASLVRPELIVRPDPARAADLGVTTQAIAETLRVATAGDYDQSLPKLNLAQRQVPIVVRLPVSARADLSYLRRLPVPSTRPGVPPVPLDNVAQVDLGSGPVQIDRYDRRRNVNFEIELNGRALGEVSQEVAALAPVRELPAGVTQGTVGDAEMMQELFSSFGLAMLTGVLCIYVVLVLLFKDFVQPVTILAALVLSIPGAFLALFLTHTALSMPSLIGLIMLMGIATKNSILLVDYVILARRDHGMSRYDALIDACRKRARPIVMTTLAMGAGMMPLALGWGVDPSFRAPMAIVVIGGLITSTFLSLLIVPVVFTFVDDIAHAVGRLFHRRGAPAAAN